MEATVENKESRRRRKNTKGQKKHWAIWLTFGVAFGVIICEAITTLGMVFLPL
ncbi:MAG: hypothetical protein HEP71_28930 [Roseivirga sp.]|nr:hypothetical protein [Roseivirga sp.]